MSAGTEFLDQIQAVWQTDERFVEEIEDGFNWWPGHHKVTVRCFPKNDASDPDAWRITITTEFLKGVNVHEPKVAALIASMGRIAPTYGWGYIPPEVSKQYNRPADGAINFQSATYVRPETASWLPRFFAQVSIMQPIDAERTAVPFAEMLGGIPNKSGARVVAGSLEIDEILNVAQSIFVPMGREPSRWAGSNEFREFAERYGRSDKCFGMGGPDGLTLETPFGKRSSLIRLDHDIKHPALGSGLLGTLRLRVFESLEASTRTCMWLNFLGLSQWTGAPVHGTWHPQEIRKDEFSPSYGAFIPNSLYSDGLATSLALWNLMLTRWARMTVWPQLQDDTMHSILTARLGEIDAGAHNQ